MAEITWANAVSGDFTTASYWTGGKVPGASDDAILAADGGAPYTVSVDSQDTVEFVQSIQTASNATLALGPGTYFYAGEGTGSGTNAGTITAGGGARLAIGGTFDNIGTVDILLAGYLTARTSFGPALTLTGGGNVDFAFGDGYDNASGRFVNVNNDISGQLGLYGGGITNDRDGVIDATLASEIGNAARTPSLITNYGLIESTGSGALDIQWGVIHNTGGTILAAGNASVTIAGENQVQGRDYASVTGGLIETTGSGVVYAGFSFRMNPTVFSGAASTLELDGDIVVPDATGLSLEGAIVNEGSITLDSTPSTKAPNGDPTYLYAGAGGATLSGGGSVVLSDTNRNYISALASGDALVNVDNTISAAGTIGSGGLVFTNGAAGLVDADDSVALVLDDTAAMINDGLIEATGKGGLLIKSATVNGDGGGTVSVATGSKVLLEGGVIEGGTLSATGSGEFKAIDSGNELDGSTGAVAIDGKFVVAAGASLAGQGTIDDNAKFLVQGSATLSAVDNTSVLETDGGDLTVQGALTGAGEALIDGGAMTFGSATGQKVVFDGGGELILADSQGYSGTVWKFSTIGTDTLDLEDIAFGDDTKATYSGGPSGGVLTVTDGTHTAKIAMKGDFLSSTFTVASDDNGGTLVTDPTAAPALAQAMAGFAAAPAAPAAASASSLTPSASLDLAFHG